MRERSGTGGPGLHADVCAIGAAVLPHAQGLGCMSRNARETRDNFAQGCGDVSEILSVGVIFPPFPNGRLAPGYPVHRSLPDPDAEGGVAITRFGYPLRRIVEQSSMRQARVRAIQSEIETSTYETYERISGTVERLLHVIA